MDTGLLDMMRQDLAGLAVIERKMFGGIAFMLGGNMVCGVHRDHGTYRVGKSRQQRALGFADVAPFQSGNRAPMGGMVMAGPDAMADDAIRAQLTALSLENARELPPK